jgi:hypothetical protein
MAFILLEGRKPVFVSAKAGSQIWRVMNGELKGTQRQRQFAKQVRHIYLNYANAPQSYVDRFAPKKKIAKGQVRLPYKD